MSWSSGSEEPEEAGPAVRRSADDLANFFNVSDIIGWERAPNDVTPGELRRIAALYEDIRTERCDIVFSRGVSKGFRPLFMRDIATILQTEAGRALLGRLASRATLGARRFFTILDLGPPTGYGYEAIGAPDPDGWRIRYMPGAPYRLDGMSVSSDTMLFQELARALEHRGGAGSVERMLTTSRYCWERRLLPASSARRKQ